MKFLICDDHALIRRGLKQILVDGFPDAVFGEACDANEALNLVWNGKWDVVILDISMPGRSGIEVLKEIKTAHAGLPVLVLSAHPEDQFAVRVLKAGAAGYVTKDGAPQDLVKAVQKVVEGGRYVSPSLAEKLARDLSAGSSAPEEMLSDREFQLLRMIASGKTVKEVAGELSLSIKTVSTYRTRLLEKMGMKTNAELMRYAMERGLHQ
jgi:DNA-binding NarL/FixJ family response regulator